jgi:hypothetical protein
MSTRVTYLLGVVDAQRSVAPPLLLVRGGGVAAVCTELPADELAGSTADPLDETGPLATAGASPRRHLAGPGGVRAGAADPAGLRRRLTRGGRARH